MDGYKEATGESCHTWDNGRETDSFVWKSTDEGYEEGDPGLIQGDIHHHNLDKG